MSAPAADYIFARLEFSPDDLSDITPTWNTVAQFKEVEWWTGLTDEGQDPQPGGATIVIRGQLAGAPNRDFEPDFASGAYFPNMTTHRRFRMMLSEDDIDYDQAGLWFVTDFEIEFPAGTDYAEYALTLADGWEVLAQDDLPELDPPEAVSFPEVAMADEAFAGYALDEKFGTSAVALVGPDGNYKNTPTLGQPGLVVGDPGTSVFFGSTEGIEASLRDTIHFSDRNSFTVEAVVLPMEALDDDFGIVRVFGGSATIAAIAAPAAFNAYFADTDVAPDIFSSTVPTSGVKNHVLATYDSGVLRLYVDGALEAMTTGSPLIPTGANPVIRIGNYPAAGDDVRLQYVFLYEHALTPERVRAHADAALNRGFDEQTAGERIAAILDNPLWSTTNIQTTGRDVQPRMMHGQSRADMLRAVAHSEGPRTLVFFDRGDPHYLGHEWKASAPEYHEVQAVFGGHPGEVPYVGDPAFVYDKVYYTAVVASREGGPKVELDTDAKPRRVNTDWTEVLLVEDNHVESLAVHVREYYKTPALRPTAVILHGSNALEAILTLRIGHLVQVLKRGGVGDEIDRICSIIGYRMRYDEAGHLACTFYLSRGFNGATPYCRAGITGFCAAGTAKAA